MVTEQRRTGNNSSFRGIAGIGDEPGICSRHVGSNGGHSGSQTLIPAIVVAAQKQIPGSVRRGATRSPGMTADT